MTTDPASPRIIGQRLAEARRARSIKQDDAAEAIGVSRPTFIAIEKGEREAKPPEIVKLAALYGQPVSHFVRTMEPLTDFQPHFRLAMEKVKPADAEQLKVAIRDFKEFVENYLDLEKRMKSPKRFAKLRKQRAKGWRKFLCMRIRFRTRRSANSVAVAFCCGPLRPEPASLPAVACARLSKLQESKMCSRNR